MSYFGSIRLEMSREGKPSPQHSALSFLERILKSNRTDAFRLGGLVQEDELKFLVDIKDHPANETLLREEQPEEHRVVANIISLAVFTSVGYAQGTLQFLFQA